MTLPIHPPSQTFHIESKATSLGHFILIAKHSNLIYNTHTHKLRCPHMVVSLKSNRKARGSEVRSETQLLYNKSATQNLPLALTKYWGGSLSLSPPVSFIRGHLSLLFFILSSTPLTTFFLHALSSVFFSTATTTRPASLMLSAHHFHMQLFQWLDHTLLLED